jgi:hypothetical protein
MAGSQTYTAAAQDITVGSDANPYVLQILAPSNCDVSLWEYFVKFKGTSATAEQPVVEIHRIGSTNQGTFDTAVTVEPTSARYDAASTTVKKAVSSNPTTTGLLWSAPCHPQGGIHQRVAVPNGILIPAGEGVVIRIDNGSTELDCDINVLVEE